MNDALALLTDLAVEIKEIRSRLDGETIPENALWTYEEAAFRLTTGDDPRAASEAEIQGRAGVTERWVQAECADDDSPLHRIYLAGTEARPQVPRITEWSIQDYWRERGIP